MKDWQVDEFLNKPGPGWFRYCLDNLTPERADELAAELRQMDSYDDACVKQGVVYVKPAPRMRCCWGRA